MGKLKGMGVGEGRRAPVIEGRAKGSYMSPAHKTKARVAASQPHKITPHHKLLCVSTIHHARAPATRTCSSIKRVGLPELRKGS